MNKLLLYLYLCSFIGCSSGRYGYSLEEWNNLTQDTRDKIKIEADNNLISVLEEEREKEFINRPINIIFGTRSNKY